jgi:SAM-dependent methyltransferase
MFPARSLDPELMDAEDLSAETYAEVMHDLARVNSLTLARRPTIGFLNRVLKGKRSLRLLDVGFGDGDMLRAIAVWAQRRGIEAELTGIDLNPRSAPAAMAATDPELPIRYLTGDYADLRAEGFDIIVSSLVAHHMTHAELIGYLRFMESEALSGWYVNDLHRHGFAWAGFKLLSAAMRWHPIVRHDGLLSIRRSYRPTEWSPILREAGISGASVHRVFPFRLCVSRIR